MPVSRRFYSLLLLLPWLVLWCPPATAFTPRQEPARLDGLALPAPGGVIGVTAVRVGELPAGDSWRRAWDQFAREQGNGWQAWIDERSGLPTLAMGSGIAWISGGGNQLPEGQVSLETLEALARDFFAHHAILLGSWNGQLELDREASGLIDGRVWQIAFRQVVNGVPVEGARYSFQVALGNLVAFGATRWAEVTETTSPAWTREAARAVLDAYLGPHLAVQVADLESGSLRLIPVEKGGSRGGVYRGPRGKGYDHLLVWRFAVEVPGEPAVWVAEVNAQTGKVVGLFDDTRYGRVKGGVYPLSGDGIGFEGTEQTDFPLPFADVSVNGGAASYADDQGVYSCSGSGSVVTSLSGKYIKVGDKCGAVSESTTCPKDLDLKTSTGTDCIVPSGSSAGNTHAARSSFYHLNRVMEKGRAWLPDNTWLKSQVGDNVNISSTCNAFWNGSSVNFYRSGGGCRNTGELQGVFVHEWGHGLDNYDGGGYDNPSEAYADTVALFESHESCVGRGFFMTSNCSGYGDPCLACTGIRDQDYAKHQNNTPATTYGFAAHNCGGGDGPCGREGHCEAYVAAETVWDLATRDLPAMGLDLATSWQLTEKLFYLSRAGSGGNAYNCALPHSDGCSTESWFQKFRLQDDGDGNLNNGTPHAAAIFAAFARHGIACGEATDLSNKNSSNCPPLAKPVLSADPSGTTVKLSWNSVANSAKTLILRNDMGCERGQVIIDKANNPATTYTDTSVASGFTLYYRVQAQGSNSACESPVSDCVAVSTPGLAGKVQFDRSSYSCSGAIGVRVYDGNVGGTSLTVKIWSTTEPDFETVTLNESPAGSGKFLGSISAAGGSPVHGDGLLSIASGDTLTVEYIDANDGEGGTNLVRRATAGGDCQPPSISGISVQDVTEHQATIVWTTDEPTEGMVLWGANLPPQTIAYGVSGATTHAITLDGLASCNVYFFDVQAIDPASNLTVADNSGQHFQFQTLGDFGQGPEPCHSGAVRIDQTGPSCGDVISFSVVDMDLNADPNAVETATVTLTSTSEIVPEVITLTESSTNSLRFTGSIQLQGADPVHDGALQVKNGDLITVAYFDAGDGHGHAAHRFATVATDCRGPVISAIRVNALSNARGTVRFTTQEPGDTVVEWGTTPALGQVASDSALTTDHAILLNQFDSCRTVYFRVKSRDGAGNQAVADNLGSPFVFRTWTIPGLYWKETFENSTGWTLGSEWEIGVPRGKGAGTQGFPDPSSAYNNNKILGHDLTGLGSSPGDYEKGTNQKAVSPTFNAGSWHNSKLIFFRQLNAGWGDESSVYVCYGTCNATWRSNSQEILESGYSMISYDVSDLLDGETNAHIEFRQNSVLGSASGWNIDDVIIKNGALADFAACGGCGQGPSFAGATSAVDNNPCGGEGVTIFWEPAVAWGTGAQGTYAVYRGTAPGFAPDSAHRVAAGLTALSYIDASAPAGTFYYLVRAENNETCGGGPANNGLTDSNTNYVAVTKTTSQPVPDPVSGLMVALINGVHVRLTWNPAAAASSFDILRAVTPQTGAFTSLGLSPAASFDDLGQATDPQTRFYLVKGVNACGQAGP